MFLLNPVDDSDILLNVLLIDCNLHSLSAQYIRRSYKHRIPKTFCRLFCLLCRKYSGSIWSRNITFFQDLIKPLSVFRCIYILRRSSQNRNSHFHQRLCQLNGSLSAKLYHCPIRFFQFHNAFHIFCSQRLKIQFIGNIKIRTDGFRIVIDNDCLISFLCKCPGTVNRTKIKFDSLTDSDRTGAQHQYLLFPRRPPRLIFTSIHRIIVRCFCFKFCRTRIHHLISRKNFPLMTEPVDFPLGPPI